MLCCFFSFLEAGAPEDLELEPEWLLLLLLLELFGDRDFLGCLRGVLLQDSERIEAFPVGLEKC